MDELFNKIQKLIAEKLEIDESKITMDSSFRGDLGADSLDLVDLSMSIEEEFNLEVPDDVLDHGRHPGRDGHRVCPLAAPLAGSPVLIPPRACRIPGLSTPDSSRPR